MFVLFKQRFIQTSDFSDKKSERAKDMHLLKRLTMILKNRDLDPGENLLHTPHENLSIDP